MDGHPKRGDYVSFWLTLRIRAAEEGGAGIVVVMIMEKMLAEYHWCADHDALLPVTTKEVDELGRVTAI